MAKLVSLKLSTKEAKKDYGSPESVSRLPEYPYGTRLSFDNETVEKLDLEDVEVRQKVTITAEGYVSEKSTRDIVKGEARTNVEIQLTDISVTESGAAKKEKREAAHLDTIAGAKRG